MSQPNLDSVISWCQDWFYKKPKSLQSQINDLAKRVSALEKGGTPDPRIAEETASLKAKTDAVARDLAANP